MNRRCLAWLLLLLLWVVAGCAGAAQRSAPAQTAVSAEQPRAPQLSQQLQDALAAPMVDCALACALAEQICRLGERVCQVEEPDMVAPRCPEARERCERARQSTAQHCQCADTQP